MSSGKYAKVQKRRRWCDHGLQVPQAYRQQLQAISEQEGDATTAAATVQSGLLPAAAAAGSQQPPAAAAAAAAGQPDAQLAQQLLRFITIQCTYGEVEELKTSVAAAERLAGTVPADCPSWGASMQLLLELLFFENSRPLHKQLLAFVRKLPQQHQQVVGELLACRIQQEAAAVLGYPHHQQQQQQDDDVGPGTATAKAAAAVALLQELPPLSAAAAQRGLTLAQAAVSLLWLPTARDWMTTCAPALLLAVSSSVHSTLGPAAAGKHLTPNIMELVQDAISVLYYTMQQQGQHLAGPAGVQGAAAVAAAAACMLEALQGTALVREAMASAAVVVWAAATLPDVPAGAAAAAFAAGLTPCQLDAAAAGAVPDTVSSSSSVAESLQELWGSRSLLEQSLQARGSSLVLELQRASPTGRICAFRGLLTAMPAAALLADISCWQQQQQHQQQEKLRGSISSSGVTFIMDCVLLFAVAAARSSPDAHYKFHAVSVVAVALQRAMQLWQELPQLSAASPAAAAAPAAPVAAGEGASQAQQQEPAVNDSRAAAAAAVTQHVQQPSSSSSDSQSATTQMTQAAAAAVAPLLAGPGLTAVVGLLWGNLDEPMAQTLNKVQDAFEALLALLVCQDSTARQLQLDHTAVKQGDSSSSSSSSIGSCGSGCVVGFGSWDDSLGSFLSATACAVLAVAPSRKGRYGPLTSLLQWVGAGYLLQQQPGLVHEALVAMQYDMVASTATGFLKAMLLQLRREQQGSEAPAAAAVLAATGTGNTTSQQQQQQNEREEQLLKLISDDQLRAWCRWWLPALLEVLWGPNERFRTYVTNHALPVVLQSEPLLLRPIVNMIMAAHAAGTEPVAAGCNEASALCKAVAAAADAGAGVGSVAGVPNATAALVVVLKAARKMQLIGNLDTLLPLQQQQQQRPNSSGVAATATAIAEGGGSSHAVELQFSPAGLLLSAVSSSSAALRMEALELACVNSRSTEPPGELELALARRWLLLCLRCTGAGSRSKSLVMWGKLLTRQRAAVATIRTRAATATRKPGATGGAHPGAVAKASPNHAARAAAAAAAAASDIEVLQRQYEFVRWLSQTLIDSLYPGGPYERKYYALQLLAVLLAQWKPTSADVPSSSSNSTDGLATANPAAAAAAAVDPAAAVMPLCGGLLSAAAVQVLLGCLVDSWDKLRMAASSVLERLPSPLPGLEQPQQLQPLLSWALQLTNSPRIRESDAGARLLQLLLVKYVLGLNWRVQLYPEPSVQSAAAAMEAAPSNSKGAAGNADALVPSVMCFLSSLTAQLRSQLFLAHSDLAAASRRGLVHGIVLALRYAADEVSWTKLASSSSTASATVCAAAAAAAGSGGSGVLQVQQASSSSSCNGAVAAAAAAVDAACSSEELVVVNGPALLVLRAWLADLFGLLTEAAQLARPYLSAQDLNLAADEVEEDGEAGSDADLDDLQDELHCEADSAGQEVHTHGAELSGPAVQLLITACWTSVKELSLLIGTLARRLPLPGAGSSSGSSSAATDTTQQQQHPSDASGSSSSSDILQPQQLAQLGDLLLLLLLSMKHNGAIEKSQPGFLWLAEQLLQSPRADLNSLPAGWLARCLARVQQPGQCRDDIVRRSAGLPFSIACLFLSEPHGVPRQLLPQGLQQLLDTAQDAALPEPWPRMHAFNCLRCVFNDAALAMDTSGFHAAGVAAAIRGMAAEAWEVRNAAALTFTALVMRVIGFKNAGTKQLQAKPLQQLAATAADLNLHFATSAVAGSSYSAAATAAAAAARSSWGVKSPTATDFFYRYPQLHVFLLQQLQQAAELLQQHNSAAAAAAAAAGGCCSSQVSSQSGQLPPSLFPVLVILSRLRPSLQLSSLSSSSSSSSSSGSSSTSAGMEGPTTAAAAEGAAAAAASPLTPAAFVPAVLAVGRSAVMGVRQIAAASLAPLVAADQLPAMCQELASSLPHDAADARQGVVTSQNVLHGTLLQLAALLRAVATSNAASGAEGSAAAGSSAASANVAALVVDLLPVFVGSSWLGRSCSSASGAVRQAYVAAAGQLIILAYTHWPALLDASSGSSSNSSGSVHVVSLLQQLVSRLISSCSAAVQQTVPANGSSSSTAAVVLEAADPQHCCWLRDCTMMLLGHLLRLELLLQQQQCSIEASSYVQELLLQLQHCLPSCIASSSYEVRAAALKAAAVQLDHVLQLMPQLPGLLSSGNAAAGALQQLSAQLWTALEHEKTVKVVQRQLVVLGQLQSLQSLQPAVQPDVIVLQRLRASLAVGRQYKQLEVRIVALTCAAREVRPAVDAACKAAAAGGSSSSSNDTDSCLGTHATAYLQYMQQLLQLVQTCSHYGQQEELRAAAADALHLSGLLQPLAAAAVAQPTTTSSSSSSSVESLAVARLSLSAWAVAVRLMEDEEDMVRQPAADAAQQVLQILQQPHPSAAAQLTVPCKGLDADAAATSSSSSSRSWGVAAEPSSSTGQYVEAVEQSTFDLLASCSSWWPELLPEVLQLLAGVVFEAGTAVPEVLLQHSRRQQQQQVAATASTAAAGTAAASGVLAGVLVRRLFEKEADNHHEEQVLLAQHAAAALQRTLQHMQLQATVTSSSLSTAAAAAQGAISSWCAGLVKYLSDTLRKMSAVSSSTAGGWVGGDTNHPEVFVPLYRCLLGLLAAAPWWARASSSSSSSSSSNEQLAVVVKPGTSAAATVKSSVCSMVGQLLQLQPTVLLLPVLRELQRACQDGDAVAAASTGSRGVLFLTQRN